MNHPWEVSHFNRTHRQLSTLSRHHYQFYHFNNAKSSRKYLSGDPDLTRNYRNQNWQIYVHSKDPANRSEFTYTSFKRVTVTCKRSLNSAKSIKIRRNSFCQMDFNFYSHRNSSFLYNNPRKRGASSATSR